MTHFNQLTPAEECGEVIFAIGKILRHGYKSYHPEGSTDNREDLRREGVMTIMQASEDTALITHEQIDRAWKKKLRYSHHQIGDGL